MSNTTKEILIEIIKILKIPLILLTIYWIFLNYTNDIHLANKNSTLPKIIDSFLAKYVSDASYSTKDGIQVKFRIQELAKETNNIKEKIDKIKGLSKNNKEITKEINEVYNDINDVFTQLDSLTKEYGTANIYKKDFEKYFGTTYDNIKNNYSGKIFILKKDLTVNLQKEDNQVCYMPHGEYKLKKGYKFTFENLNELNNTISIKILLGTSSSMYLYNNSNPWNFNY